MKINLAFKIDEKLKLKRAENFHTQNIAIHLSVKNLNAITIGTTAIIKSQITFNVLCQNFNYFHQVLHPRVLFKHNILLLIEMFV